MKAKIGCQKFANASAMTRKLLVKDELSPFSKTRLDVTTGAVSLTTSDGDTQLEVRFMEDDAVFDAGCVLVPGARLAAFAGALRGAWLTLETKGEKLEMSDDAGTAFKLATIEDETFPVMATPKDKAGAAWLPSALLREMLRKVKYAADRCGGRSAVSGVNVKLGNSLFEMTATDGRRLSHVEREVERDNGKDFAFTLANKAVDTLYDLLAKDEGDVMVQADAKSAVFMGDEWTLTSKIIDAKFPQWAQIVPKDPENVAEIGREEFLEKLAQAALASGDELGVTVELKPGLATFKARSETSEACATTGRCKVQEGVKGEFTFNPHYLKDALESVDVDSFTLAWKDGDGTGPVVLKCAGLPWLAVIMPMSGK